MSSSYWAGLQGKHANLVIRDYPIISLVLHGEWKKRWTIIYKLYRLIYIENQYYEWTSICWLKKKHLCLNRNLIGSFENYLEGIFHAWLESLGIQESFLHYGPNPQVFRRKWANAHFKKTIQHFAPLSKLIREMPLFWNSIFSKSSYKKKKIMEPYNGVLRSL